MAYYVKQNNASSLVVGTLSASVTTLNVTPGEGANFPSSFPYLLTIWTGNNPGNDSGIEIVRCTNRSTDALTIVRAQEGTGDVEHSAGEYVAMLTTAGLFNDSTYGIEGNLDIHIALPNDHHNESHNLDSHTACTLAELSTDISDATLASTAGTETFTNKIIEIEDILGSDHTYEGITINDTVGESVVFGNLLYMNTSGTWMKASTAIASGAEFPVRAMAMATIASSASGVLLLSGTVRDDSWNFTTLGKVYCGVDVPTHTRPTTSGYTVQIIGTSLDDDNLYFNPSQTYVELA